MKPALKLASLFDGSGGFPLGGMLAGILPVWASEVEPFPIRVTTKRIPKMKHYGDVSKIDGAKVEPVDVITFGSPCQDMSVAGKRAGLDGNRSGLFYQAVRIIKEMRGATNGLYPRYAVWENVPGAFTSNGGQDFRAVLEELCRVKDPGVTIPMPEKWQRAGLIMGDGYSIAWRQLDAQYWGVPQRRKRIYLVADFNGESAGKILFESESVSGYSSPSRSPWKRVARNTTQGVGETVVLNDQGGERMEVTKESVTTLRAEARHPPVVCEGCDPYNGETTGEVSSTLGVNCGMSSGRQGVVEQYIAIENHPADSRVRISDDGNVETLTSRMGTGGGNVPLVMKTYGISGQDSNAMKSDNPHSGIYEADTSRTLDCNGGNPTCNQGGMCVVALEGNGARPSHQGDGYSTDGVSYTLNTIEKHAVAYGLDRASFNQGRNAKYDFAIEKELAPTLVAKGPGAVNSNYSVRRLTPMECARLQGFPDTWCDNLETPNPTKEDLDFWRGVFKTYTDMTGTKMKTDAQITKWLQAPHSDSAEYKMWGNGVALPCVVFVMSGIVWSNEAGEQS
jgi:DNA (cytosine-5)-methyltransferase 1